MMFNVVRDTITSVYVRSAVVLVFVLGINCSSLRLFVFEILNRVINRFKSKPLCLRE